MEDLFKAFFGSCVRFVLAIAVGWLVRKGIIEEKLGAEILLALPLAIVGLVWSYIVKARDAERFKIALALPANASPEKVEQIRKEQQSLNGISIK